MKKIVLLIALFTSFILVSCSENTTGPANDNSNKTSTGQYQFPYEYLTSFQELKVLDWNQPATSNSHDVTLRLERNVEDIRDLYVMVTYKDPTQDTQGQSVLYFLNQPGEKDLKLSLDDKLGTPADIKAFARNATEIEANPPFEDSHSFRGVFSTWEIRENQLIISAMPWTTDIIEVFAYIERPGSDEILYLQKPVSAGKIIIPDFHDGDVQNVQLFVNSNPLIDKL